MTFDNIILIYLILSTGLFGYALGHTGGYEAYKKEARKKEYEEYRKKYPLTEEELIIYKNMGISVD